MTNKFCTNNQSLADWLFYLESIHPQEIELGLSRVKAVANQLGLLQGLGHVILVAGTNGKGSTCAYLEQLIIATGATTGVFSSPHIIHYNERLRINGQELADDKHVEALRFVELGRGDTQLTYFEFNTLAALYLMKQANVDYFVLEVGLGGRLDSTNIVDADLAIITTIDLDHQSWLGDTREAVSYEKAGIFRAKQRVICGEPNPPQPLLDHAKTLNCDISFKGQQFGFEAQEEHWHWHSETLHLGQLPLTRLPMTNAATALAAFEKLGLSLNIELLRDVIENTSLCGRLQTISLAPQVVLDVAHNPQAGGYLANWLARQHANKVLCVVGMLADKDSQSTLSIVEPLVDKWYLASLDGPRAASSSMLANSLQTSSQQSQFGDVLSALAQAKKDANEDDLILVFGSFFTVAAALENTLK
ncbi:MAG: bifunctional tetrahydrofolate synthase/dihydrofolate synthase [Psychrobium sp.]|nr:bifunctional tetrahydrofolate synthase/dihydrofolate synthase [Psychrobium sp.]